mmetsp:Transcript_27746/g.59310  ORF Transcript_27746/g.59310 Transcript_27746/m.59310 type:complete len:858 (+) Transcript_27746:51-2624(+)|eukprot:CAMPEP_0201121836 /NCGR_PEP_ID=MMETSP0850-20130426/5623_1 /ASSEMBLY_ACC=CAM_ASM_000622 /TAXON_ID=183588 /ORGANISM="Pseudo-nitzschia fraudulenta, Strain WWA7" /LENGTH=857 /DNA_ID=CAMNT_0047388391 /DNA_START=54 /DNA_END=2627 /DNA_ORIENTATION=+
MTKNLFVLVALLFTGNEASGFLPQLSYGHGHGCITSNSHKVLSVFDKKKYFGPNLNAASNQDSNDDGPAIAAIEKGGCPWDWKKRMVQAFHARGNGKVTNHKDAATMIGLVFLSWSLVADPAIARSSSHSSSHSSSSRSSMISSNRSTPSSRPLSTNRNRHSSSTSPSSKRSSKKSPSVSSMSKDGAAARPSPSSPSIRKKAGATLSGGESAEGRINTSSPKGSSARLKVSGESSSDPNSASRSAKSSLTPPSMISASPQGSAKGVPKKSTQDTAEAVLPPKSLASQNNLVNKSSRKNNSSKNIVSSNAEEDGTVPTTPKKLSTRPIVSVRISPGTNVNGPHQPSSSPPSTKKTTRSSAGEERASRPTPIGSSSATPGISGRNSPDNNDEKRSSSSPSPPSPGKKTIARGQGSVSRDRVSIQTPKSPSARLNAPKKSTATTAVVSSKPASSQDTPATKSSRTTSPKINNSITKEETPPPPSVTKKSLTREARQIDGNSSFSPGTKKVSSAGAHTVSPVKNSVTAPPPVMDPTKKKGRIPPIAPSASPATTSSNGELTSRKRRTKQESSMTAKATIETKPIARSDSNEERFSSSRKRSRNRVGSRAKSSPSREENSPTTGPASAASPVTSFNGKPALKKAGSKKSSIDHVKTTPVSSMDSKEETTSSPSSRTGKNRIGGRAKKPLLSEKNGQNKDGAATRKSASATTERTRIIERNRYVIADPPTVNYRTSTSRSYYEGESSREYYSYFPPRSPGSAYYYDDFAPPLRRNESYPPYRRPKVPQQRQQQQQPPLACPADLPTMNEPIDVLLDPVYGIYAQGGVTSVNRRKCDFTVTYFSADGNPVKISFHIPIKTKTVF